MVDLVRIKCQNCDFDLKLLIGTSNPDQVYNDLNDDFNYHKIFYCPSLGMFISLETFNLKSNQFQLANQLKGAFGTEAECPNSIEIHDAAEFPSDIPCPNCHVLPLRLERNNFLAEG
jgi:hypothetical protein